LVGQGKICGSTTRKRPVTAQSRIATAINDCVRSSRYWSTVELFFRRRRVTLRASHRTNGLDRLGQIRPDGLMSALKSAKIVFMVASSVTGF
jgi:hypothetical protein